MTILGTFSKMLDRWEWGFGTGEWGLGSGEWESGLRFAFLEMT